MHQGAFVIIIRAMDWNDCNGLMLNGGSLQLYPVRSNWSDYTFVQILFARLIFDFRIERSKWSQMFFYVLILCGVTMSIFYLKLCSDNFSKTEQICHKLKTFFTSESKINLYRYFLVDFYTTIFSQGYKNKYLVIRFKCN